MARSVVIIGAGQIGYAAARQFQDGGWDVSVHARSCPLWQFAGIRYRTYDKDAGPAPSADAVVDTIAYDADDIARYDPDSVGRLIAISSASVYCDDDGRTLDEAKLSGFPEFPRPITEDQSTVAPGSQTYSTRKVRMERAASELFGDCATILRPCAVHGPHSRHPREWWFVKRMLDGRTQIPLRYSGQSRFQTTAARAIGELAVLAANKALGGTFNVADDDAPSVEAIGRDIAESLDCPVQFVPFRTTRSDGVGRTPWSIPKPMIVSGKKAARHGAQPGSYASAVAEAARWLARCDPADWRTAFPQLAAYPWNLFDYAADNRFLRSH